MAVRTKARPGYGDTEEVAAYTGYSKGHLANLRSQGKGPKWTSGGKGRGHKALYRWADVDQWLKDNERSTTP